MRIDTEQMRVFVADGKVKCVHDLAKRFLLLVQQNRHLVPVNQIRRLCSVCISLTLALPLARFYTRSLFFDIAGPRLREGNGRKRHLVCLSQQSIRNLRFWNSLTRGEGRELKPPNTPLTMHVDALTVGCEGTLGPVASPGPPGSWVAQGFWSGLERNQSISLREHRSDRLLIQKSFAAYMSDPAV